MSRSWLSYPPRRSVAAALREGGVRNLFFSALSRTVYRRLLLLERRLDDLPNPAGLDAVAVEQLSPCEADDYRGLRPDTPVDEIARRLTAGDRCFVVRDRGRIVHAGWAAQMRARIDFLDMEIVLAPGDIYQYDSYTAPDVRGRNIAPIRIAAMARYLRRAGYARLIAAVLPENASGLRPLHKLGYRRCGYIGVLRIGTYRRTLTRGSIVDVSSAHSLDACQ